MPSLSKLPPPFRFSNQNFEQKMPLLPCSQQTLFHNLTGNETLPNHREHGRTKELGFRTDYRPKPYWGEKKKNSVLIFHLSHDVQHIVVS
jgi:hypothetical protein